jgi:hypothetical protein
MLGVLGYISNAQGVKVIIGANSLRVKLRCRILSLCMLKLIIL